MTRRLLYEAPDHPEGEQVIPEDIAHDVTEIMVGDVTEGIAKDASLGDRPVAGKTGTSENFFDAWFIGYTPELVTSTWMGYAEGVNTLEYVLDYARKLHGLSGGINPAMIWKSYTQQVLEGQPIEQFEGVTLPESKEKTAPAEPGTTKNAPGVRDRAPAARRARAAARRADRAAGGAPASAASASAAAPNVSPARRERSRANRRGTVRAGNAPSSVAPSSASPPSVAPQ